MVSPIPRQSGAGRASQRFRRRCRAHSRPFERERPYHARAWPPFYDDIEWQKVIGHREAGQHDEGYRALRCYRVAKGAKPGGVDKPRSDVAAGPHG